MTESDRPADATTAPLVPIEIHDREPDEIVAELIERSIALPASDLFLATDSDCVQVSVRHLGVVRPLTTFPTEQGRRLLSHIKAMAGMDITARRHPCDGRWIHERDSGSKIDLRINSIPTLHGEDMAIRLLARDSALRSLDGLGLSRHELNQLVTMFNSPSGLVLATGPTGSGKTTTLYACIEYLNDGRRKINTIEDPIEYSVSGVRQSQVNPRIDLDFPELLRSVLRQAPDVIMIGEVRDPITAATAVRAANSGHLVFATLHAPIAAAAVASMLALGVRPHFLASSLLGIVSQRLVRTLCNQCKLAVDMSEAPLTFEPVHQWLEPGDADVMYAATGCDECHQDGFAGRTAVFEFLNVSKETRALIAGSRSIAEIEQQAVSEGMVEFRRAALLKVALGVTSIDEILRSVPTEYLGVD